MIADLHCHFYPVKYLRWLEDHEALPKSWQTDLRPNHSQIGTLMKSMEDGGISVSILTTGNLPWPDVLQPKDAVSLAMILNDEIAAQVEKYPDRLIGLAVLPYSVVPDAIDELNRAVTDLGLAGVFLPSNIAGKPVDMPELVPLYAEISKLDVPLFIHPTRPEAPVNMEDYRFVEVLGFTCNTALALSRLILSGMLEKFPLKIVAAHAGGVLPYVIGRLGRAYEMWPDEVGKNISKNPREYFREVYADQICFSVPSIVCARDTLGMDRLVFGSDYPFGWGTQSDFVKWVHKLPFSEEEREKLFWRNADRLLHLG